MNDQITGKLLVISGPSAGVGKDTILNMFKQAHPDWICPPSATTRAPREGESPGVDMIFMSREEFESRIKKNDFFEYFEVAGNFYGTLREPVLSQLGRGKNVVLRKDVQGAIEIKKSIPAATTIILMPESWEILKARMRKRGTDSDEVIEHRLELAKEEMMLKDKFDIVVVNPEGHPERALKEVEEAVGL